MKQFFISDPHFGDDRIRKYENRPFSNVQEMDRAMIRRWNAVVQADDEVYVLGDVGSTEYLPLLNGIKYLVKGNHDTADNDAYRAAGFREVYDHPIILDSFWILSHEPLYVNTNMPYANLFGHVHANPIFKTYSPQHYCVSVERTDYAPISFARIKEIIKEASSHE